MDILSLLLIAVALVVLIQLLTLRKRLSADLELLAQGSRDLGRETAALSRLPVLTEINDALAASELLRSELSSTEHHRDALVEERDRLLGEIGQLRETLSAWMASEGDLRERLIDAQASLAREQQLVAEVRAETEAAERELRQEKERLEVALEETRGELKRSKLAVRAAAIASEESHAAVPAVASRTVPSTRTGRRVLSRFGPEPDFEPERMSDFLLPAAVPVELPLLPPDGRAAAPSRWTEEDDRALLEGYLQERSVSATAGRVERDERDVAIRLVALLMSPIGEIDDTSAANFGASYSDTDTREILAEWLDGRQFAAIARDRGRSQLGIGWKLLDDPSHPVELTSFMIPEVVAEAHR